MGISERTYSVLIVSASKNFTDAVRSLLSDLNCEPVLTASSASAARRILAERSMDQVLISYPLPDETGTRFAIDISSSSEAVVLLSVPSEIHSEICEKTSEYGVFTLPRPLSRSSMSLALGWLRSAREKLRRAEKKTISIEEKMNEIRLVNRAKWLLISELKMDEAGAHRYIEKQAMDQCVSKSDIARGIIRRYSKR